MKQTIIGGSNFTATLVDKNGECSYEITQRGVRIGSIFRDEIQINTAFSVVELLEFNSLVFNCMAELIRGGK